MLADKYADISSILGLEGTLDGGFLKDLLIKLSLEGSTKSIGSPEGEFL